MHNLFVSSLLTVQLLTVFPRIFFQKFPMLRLSELVGLVGILKLFVNNRLKILIPAGTKMMVVADVHYAHVSTSALVLHMRYNLIYFL
jgi:hypothetical protein